jgi:hypothetical protein
MEICKECNLRFKNLKALSTHIRRSHLSIKDYYDKYFKTINEDICQICKKNNEFVGLVYGYKNGCCKEHMNILGYEKRKKQLKEKYGVENQFQLEKIKEKIKKTWNEKYGVDNPNKNKKIREKIKNTCIFKYGVDHNFKNEKIKEKRKQTWINNLGVDNPFKNKNGQKKIMNTNILKYDVKNPMQNLSLFTKAFRTRIKIKQYNDTNLYYQGSYEKHFLDKYYKTFDIENGPSIEYEYNGQKKIYHSDFYIPLKNLIVEIKSSYTLILDEEINAKKEFTLKKFNYICILDKNYGEFERNYCS